jgi:hypothetical protein
MRLELEGLRIKFIQTLREESGWEERMLESFDAAIKDYLIFVEKHWKEVK